MSSGPIHIDSSHIKLTEVDKYRVDVIAPGDNDIEVVAGQRLGPPEAPVFPPQRRRLTERQSTPSRNLRPNRRAVPASVFVSDKHELNPVELGERFGYPLDRQNPPTWGGSDNVVLAESAEDLRNRVIDNDDYRFQPLVQEFVPGQDVGLNVFAVDGPARGTTDATG